MNIRRLPAIMPVMLILGVLLAHAVYAQQAGSREAAPYTIKPGDKLQVSVWNESELQKELLVAPDGTISFPLVGEISVIGKSVVDVRKEFSSRLAKYIADPIVTVTISEVLGNKIYVIGQVNRPGVFVVNPMVDVMQALSMAGGTTAFASLNNILILRRNAGKQVALPFRFGDVSSGKNLDMNIVLESGDVVVVP